MATAKALSLKILCNLCYLLFKISLFPSVAVWRPSASPIIRGNGIRMATAKTPSLKVEGPVPENPLLPLLPSVQISLFSSVACERPSASTVTRGNGNLSEWPPRRPVPEGQAHRPSPAETGSEWPREDPVPENPLLSLLPSVQISLFPSVACERPSASPIIRRKRELIRMATAKTLSQKILCNLCYLLFKSSLFASVAVLGSRRIAHHPRKREIRGNGN
jgi:hypothetical protein